MTLALCGLLALLLGSLPSGLLLGWAIAGRDIRRFGSGNIGASNAASLGGLRLGLIVGVMDVLKGVMAVLAGRLLGLDNEGLAIVAGAAVLGHDFSLFLLLKGGKGVATTLGAFLALAPVVGVAGFAIWVMAARLTGYASAGSLIALAALPLISFATHQPESYTFLALGLFALGAGKHYQNISRLVKGTERPLRGAKRA